MVRLTDPRESVRFQQHRISCSQTRLHAPEARHRDFADAVDPFFKRVEFAPEIVAKSGYWIYSVSEIPTRNADGYAVLDTPGDRLIRLYDGWNLIAPSMPIDISDERVAGSIRSVWLWNAEHQRFQLQTGNSIHPLVGYWVYASGDVSLN